MNHNGIIDAGELLSLSDQNVTSLSTLYEVEHDQFGNVKTDEYGNTIGFVGSFKMLVEDMSNINFQKPL